MYPFLSISAFNLTVVAGIFFCFVYLFYLFYKAIFVKNKALNSSIFDLEKNKNSTNNIPFDNTKDYIIKKANKIQIDNVNYQFIDLGNQQIIIMKQEYYESDSVNDEMTKTLLDDDLGINQIDFLQSHNEFEFKTMEEEDIEASIDSEKVNSILVNTPEEIEKINKLQMDFSEYAVNELENNPEEPLEEKEEESQIEEEDSFM